MIDPLAVVAELGGDLRDAISPVGVRWIVRISAASFASGVTRSRGGVTVGVTLTGAFLAACRPCRPIIIRERLPFTAEVGSRLNGVCVRCDLRSGSRRRRCSTR